MTISSQIQLQDLNVVCLGVGNMGGPVLDTFLKAGVSPERVKVKNSSAESTAATAENYGVKALQESDLTTALEHAEVIVLGLKPQYLLDVLTPLAQSIQPGTIVVSLAAGITLEKLTAVLPQQVKVVRAMPNTLIQVGSGVVSLMTTDIQQAERDLVNALFSPAGYVTWIPERNVHAAIATAGSANAFVFTVIEAMIDHAVCLGLPRNQAEEMVLATVGGSAKYLLENNLHPAVAKAKVCSPGGTTARGLAAMEAAGIRAALQAAMQTAAETSAEMSQK